MATVKTRRTQAIGIPAVEVEECPVSGEYPAKNTSSVLRTAIKLEEPYRKSVRIQRKPRYTTPNQVHKRNPHHHTLPALPTVPRPPLDVAIFPLTTFAAATVLSIFPALGRFREIVFTAEPGLSAATELEGVEDDSEVGSFEDDDVVVVLDFDLDTLFRKGLGRFSSSARSYFGVDSTDVVLVIPFELDDPEGTLFVDEFDETLELEAVDAR